MNLRKIKQLLEDTFNVQVEIDSRPTEDGLEIRIKPSGINRASNFVTVFLLAWRSISFEFGLGSYAKDSIIYAIKNADNQKKSLFNSMCSEISENQGSLTISLDGAQLSDTDVFEWPRDWNVISMNCRIRDEVQVEGEYSETVVLPWISRFWGLSLALIHTQETDMQGEDEGSTLYRLSKQYERSPKNRKDCIAYHGLDCKVCGMNFKDIYGELGENFIHVHHIVPLSEMENSYKLNPREDLVPLCPNCHAMVHRHDPVLLPDELKEILRQEDS